MIEIPEEKLFKDICALLMDALPAVLLEIEEHSSDGVRLPAFRYVGSPGKLPVGCALPYAFVEVLEGTYSEKDRIIRNVVYIVRIKMKIPDFVFVWRYSKGIEDVLKTRPIDEWRVTLEKRTALGELTIQFLI